MRRHRVVVRLSADLPTASLVMRAGPVVLVSLHRRLPATLAREELAYSLGRLALEGPPEPGDYLLPERVKRRLSRRAMVWALARLMPEELVRQAEREEWEPWQLAEAAGVSVEAAALRIELWRQGRGG